MTESDTHQEPLPPEPWHEATLTKWGWPSPKLLERHSKSVVKRETSEPTYNGVGECPF